MAAIAKDALEARREELRQKMPGYNSAAAKDAKDKGAYNQYLKSLGKNIENVLYVVKNHPSFTGVARNVYGGGMIWRQAPHYNSELEGKPFRNADFTHLLNEFRMMFGGEMRSITKEDSKDSIKVAAADNEFDPVKEYLLAKYEEQGWDGKHRIKDMVPHDGTEYSERVLEEQMFAQVLRVFYPGYKWDNVCILYGETGTMKSSMIANIGSIGGLGVKLVKQLPPMAHNERDLTLELHHGVTIEIGEIERFLMGEHLASSHFKDWASKIEDDVTRKYEEYPEVMKRRFVLWGSSNEPEFHTDETSSRRFRVVEVTGMIPEEHLTEEYRDLLWLEAYHRVIIDGERPEYHGWLEEEVKRRGRKNVYDPVGDAVEAWLQNPRCETGSDRRDNPMPHDVTSPYVDISMLSYPFMAQFISELSEKSMRSRRSTSRTDGKKVLAALRRHPCYQEVERKYIEGKQYKVAFELKPEYRFSKEHGMIMLSEHGREIGAEVPEGVNRPTQEVADDYLRDIQRNSPVGR